MKNKTTLRILFCSILVVITSILSYCKKGKNNTESCNGSSTRREVKIAIDDLASTIDTTAIITTVDSIGSIVVPEADSDSNRQEIEKKVFTIIAKVHKLSKHRDGDWKVELTDGNDKYVNCESPNMGCSYIDNSVFYSEMQQARDWIDANKNDLEGKTVTITGVAFIDIDHKYPRNAAENELELHPILDIHY